MFSGFWQRLRAVNAAFRIDPTSEQAAFIKNAIKDSISEGVFDPPTVRDPLPLSIHLDRQEAKPENPARDELAGTTSHPDYEHWTCGTAHIRAQRVLRIIERCADYGLTSEAIDRLDGLVDDAGPADCRRALTEQPDAVPF